MNFKKLLTVAGAAMMTMGLVSCGGAKGTYVGLGFDTTYEFDSAKAVGTATTNTAMVGFDAKGKILDVAIDAVQVKVEVGADKDAIKLNGSYNANGYVSTKMELGVNYNMKTYQPTAVAEWDLQVQAFEKWCVGKTADQVKASLTTRAGAEYTTACYTNDDTLWASCTINIEGYVNAIVDAWARKEAKEFDAKNAKAGVSMIATLSEATHGAGYDQVSVDTIGVMAIANEKAEAVMMDAITFSFKKESDNTLTHNTTTKYYENGKSVSKKALGDKYAMKVSYGSQLAEWYEQAAAYESYYAGKITSAIGKGTIEGCTITVTAYDKALNNAIKYSGAEHIGPQSK